MEKITKQEHKRLINILSELIDMIVYIRKEVEDNYSLQKNEREAIEWYRFLKVHDDKEAIKSLNREIANRYVYEFENKLCDFQIDNKRADLIEQYLIMTDKILNK